MRLLPQKRDADLGQRRGARSRMCWRWSEEELSAFRGQTVSMIFQEPALALDPVYRIGFEDR